REFPRYERSTGVGYRLHRASRPDHLGTVAESYAFLLQRVERHVGRTARRIGESDVERRHDGMIARIRRVVAGRAGSLEGWGQGGGERAVEVEARDPRDRECPGVEDRLAASDGTARFVDAAAGAVGPTVVNVKNERSEGRPRAVVAEIVVDAVVRSVTEDRFGAALGTGHAQVLGVPVPNLRGDERALE